MTTYDNWLTALCCLAANVTVFTEAAQEHDDFPIDPDVLWAAQKACQDLTAAIHDANRLASERVHSLEIDGEPLGIATQNWLEAQIAGRIFSISGSGSN